MCTLSQITQQEKALHHFSMDWTLSISTELTYTACVIPTVVQIDECLPTQAHKLSSDNNANMSVQKLACKNLTKNNVSFTTS